jgi:hypothetical protein
VDFIAKDGSKKSFKTYAKGRHRDKTPIELTCRDLLPINLFQVFVLTDDTAWGFVNRFSEEGVRLNTDKGDSIVPKNYPNYSYPNDYKESKKAGHVQIKESK